MTPQELLAAHNWRYATKKFDSQKSIPKEILHALEESVRLTPTSFGLQAQGFVWVKNREIREKLRTVSWNQSQVVDSSHLMVLCRVKEFSSSHIDRYFERHLSLRQVGADSVIGYRKAIEGFVAALGPSGVAQWLENQVYIALGNLMTSAAVLGIDACPMEGLSRSDYDRILNLEEKNLTTVVACPLGYRSTEDKYAEAPKVRFERDVVFTDII